ncbi:glycosyl hydrolase 2 galactose-binding domain-containing protein [Silvibacterium sp.]|uniref:glycosyl hydrolase 2 galactose-binding domain-containing protein n=1 Tax=Silvibacterium sp. TaxID=1964179 RepID=UPI0039E24273
MFACRDFARLCAAVLLSATVVSPYALYAQAGQPHPQIPPEQPLDVPVLHLRQPFIPYEHYGPYNAHLLTGGRGLEKPLPAHDPILNARAPWTLSAWVKLDAVTPKSILIAGAGDPAAEDSRYFALVDGKPALRLGAGRELKAAKAIGAGWHALAATYDGTTARFYVDGTEAANGAIASGSIDPQLVLGPVTPATECDTLPCPHFGGYIAGFTLARGAKTAGEIASLVKDRPEDDLIMFEDGSKPWPLQSLQYIGNRAPQPPEAMPQQNAPFSKPEAKPLPPATTTLEASTSGGWILSGGWKLVEAPKTNATPEAISTIGFESADWMPATVPGTVLSTMIDRGRYPDPDYGLDNLDIPEKLNQQDYWYRAEFATPKVEPGSHLRLVFEGINYRAEVWCNGQKLGNIDGAFMRGVFDVTRLLRADGKNAVAIRISPVPHPGIPNVQSILLGSGLNGGAMELDGPTFLASEGWDWNPPMHDRNTGLWQPVRLVASGAVEIGDPQVITRLPLPDITQADVSVNVPLRNVSGQPEEGTLTASFEGVEIHEQVKVPAEGVIVKLSPEEFHQLHLDHPRLWWPNGYGKPELYHLTLNFSANGDAPSEKKLRFGVREISYELSLLNHDGELKRLDYDPTLGREAAEPQVDVTHEGMRQVAQGWASSIAKGQDNSPVFEPVADTRATPDLIIRVNGVRIAVRGGSWGLDDSRKRVSREHLEPFFRYDRDANLDVIRNWQGQNSEEVFYDLADEYGMLVWNDFWEVTTDSNAEAEDPQLFLANAHDTILRYRNHPSIVMWCGRNEGVPQPTINRGLIALTHQLDGTRYYSPSSNQVNLEPSGPYSYENPADYYNKLDPGFAVEVGTPSLPTLEWFSRWIPKQDRWPITDDWAYHNWHPYGAFDQHMEAMFGMATSLEQYEQQAQMMNYVDYRAIFEGFNAHLWAPNGGRLLWMTQPSWPSMLWGILSSDYDTHASYYGTQKACEPLHIQLDLAENRVQVVNTTRGDEKQLKAEADVYSLDGKLLLHKDQVLDAATDNVTNAFALDLPKLEGDTTVLVHLSLTSADGTLRSRNLYWRAADDAGYRAMTSMSQAHVAVTAHAVPGAGEGMQRFAIELKNEASVPALNTKLGAFEAKSGEEVLPAFFSDNYVSLLPGESETVTLEVPAKDAAKQLTLKVRGWNVTPETLEAR